jgi:hypothetical protein
VCYQLIDPGSEWRLHRQWFEASAVADLLGEDMGWSPRTLHRCLDKLLPHKAALFCHPLAGSLRRHVRGSAARTRQHLFRFAAAGR